MSFCRCKKASVFLACQAIAHCLSSFIVSAHQEQQLIINVLLTSVDHCRGNHHASAVFTKLMENTWSSPFSLCSPTTPGSNLHRGSLLSVLICFSAGKGWLEKGSGGIYYNKTSVAESLSMHTHQTAPSHKGSWLAFLVAIYQSNNNVFKQHVRPQHACINQHSVVLMHSRSISSSWSFLK